MCGNSNPSTKERILFTAVSLMSEVGYEQVGMRVIANRVGLQVASLYNHFATKAEILEAILEYADTLFPVVIYTPEKVAELLESKPARQILYELVLLYQDSDDTLRMQLYRLLYIEQFTNKGMRNYVNDHFFRNPTNNLHTLLRILHDCGAIPPTDVESLAFVWQRTSAVFGFINTHYDIVQSNVSKPEKTADYMGLIDFFIQCAVRGVTPLEEKCAASFTKTSTPGKTYHCTDVFLPMAQRLELAAYELLDQVGGDKITVRKICDRVGIRVGSAYSHYGSKEAILDAVTDSIIKGAGAIGLRREQIVEAFRSGKLEAIVTALAQCNAPLDDKNEMVRYRVIFREQYRDRRLRQFYWNALQRDVGELTQALDELAEQNVIRRCESKKVAKAYLYTMAAIHISCTMFSEELEKMEQMRQMAGRWTIGLVLRGYAS